MRSSAEKSAAAVETKQGSGMFLFKWISLLRDFPLQWISPHNPRRSCVASWPERGGARGAQGVAQLKRAAVAQQGGHRGGVPWLRTNGVNTNGAAAKVMNFDNGGKRYAILSDLTD